MEKVKTKDLTQLLAEMGLESVTDDTYNLILYNDDVNDMLHIIESLYSICGLDADKAYTIMLEAHTNGKAVAKSGSEEEMIEMKNGLNLRKINAEVELSK